MKPWDQIEWEIGDGHHRPHLPPNVDKKVKHTAKDISSTLSRDNKIEEKVRAPQPIVDHVKKYWKESLHKQWFISEKINLSQAAISKRIKILMVSLLSVAAVKGIHEGYKAINKTEKESEKKLKEESEINLNELAWYGQTRLSRFHGALLDASDERIFWGSIYLDLQKSGPDAFRTVNYKNNLKKLWQHKFDTRPKSWTMAAMSWVYTRTIEPLVESKEGFTQYSLQRWMKDMDQDIAIINQHIDWTKVCKLTWVSLSNKELLATIFERMESKHILSYLCTELFGDLPGEFSLHYLNYLFTHAGKEYVYHIPAIYDDMASFGPYQLTSSVVRHDEKVKWSANTIQQALPEHLRSIPWSMYKLTPEQQNSATYLNMIYNFALLINKLEKHKSLSTQLKNLDKIDMEIVLQFLAVSHNSPRSAINWAISWMNHKAKKPYAEYVPGKKSIYAKRTSKFYAATQTYIKSR